MVAAAAAEAAFGKLSQPQQDHEQQIAAAEAALQRGDVESARSLAQALSTAATGKGADEQQAPTPTMEQQGRALAVIIQADFHYSNTLTDLPQLLEDSATPLHELPLHVVLLWGVVAVELQEATKARATLSAYMAGREFGEKSGVSRADALALSRLYAVQLLAGLCHEFDRAADWLEAGGAGLSEEQRDLLLLEVDEAEELMQEEHLEAWTNQHAAGAPQPPDGRRSSSSDAAPPAVTAGGAEFGSAASSVVGSNSSAAHAGAAAALQELGPSASGVLGSLRASSLHADGSIGQDTQQQQQQQQQQAMDGGAAALDVAPPPPLAGMLLAAVAAAGSDGGHDLHGHSSSSSSTAGEPTSPSLAGWRLQDADEGAALPDQCLGGKAVAGDDNAFVTLTGDIFGSDFDTAAAASAASAGSSPNKRPASHSCHTDSSSIGATRAAAAPVPDAAAAQEPEIQAAPAEQQQGLQQQQQQQPASWSNYHNATGWASSKAAEVWGSSAVQGALKALHLQDVPPWELAGGAGLALLVGWSLWRERRSMKRAAAHLAAGVLGTAQMALGLPRSSGGGAVVNAMAAVPGTSHMVLR